MSQPGRDNNLNVRHFFRWLQRVDGGRNDRLAGGLAALALVAPYFQTARDRQCLKSQISFVRSQGRRRFGGRPLARTVGVKAVAFRAFVVRRWPKMMRILCALVRQSLAIAITISCFLAEPICRTRHRSATFRRSREDGEREKTMARAG
jgi:hypothetical protein